MDVSHPFYKKVRKQMDKIILLLMKNPSDFEKLTQIKESLQKLKEHNEFTKNGTFKKSSKLNHSQSKDDVFIFLKQQISFLDKWIQKEIKKNNPKKVHKAGG
jgi:hypothetical protein